MNPQNKIVKWSVIIGIVIVLNLFFNYATSLVYKQPDYNTYCPAKIFYTPVDKQPTSEQYQQQIDCQKSYETANNAYNGKVFVVLVVVGAVSVLIGTFFKSNMVIANGLSMAGVLSFVIASVRYWSAANDLIRVIILAIALGVLFWIAWKKFRNNG